MIPDLTLPICSASEEAGAVNSFDSRWLDRVEHPVVSGPGFPFTPDLAASLDRLPVVAEDVPGSFVRRPAAMFPAGGTAARGVALAAVAAAASAALSLSISLYLASSAAHPSALIVARAAIAFSLLARRMRSGGVPLLPAGHLAALAFRAAVYGSSIVTLTLSLSHLPVGDAHVLCNSSPVLAAALEWAAWRERPTGPTLLALALCLSGMALISRPSFLGLAEAGRTAMHGGPEALPPSLADPYYPFYVFLAVFTSLKAAVMSVHARTIAEQRAAAEKAEDADKRSLLTNDHLILAMLAGQLAIGVPWFLASGIRTAARPSPYQFALLLASVAATLSGHTAMLRALSDLPATHVLVVGTLSNPLVYAAQGALGMGRPDAVGMGGSALVVAGVWTVALGAKVAKEGGAGPGVREEVRPLVKADSGGL
ncbi:hypothetical protein DFJ74DRAFT_701032 [Hyaloraphidium curvatum]|nr:hypothetical protein DFJ74DRAFT_701032 [Hyaloraphidium curvatum]